MLDAVPLAGAGRVMGNADCQTGLVGELLQLDLPEAQAGAVAAAAVGGDEQPPGAGMTLAAHAMPPAADAFDGEGGSVVIEADAGPSFVGGDIVDPVRNRLAVGWDHEVVHAHFIGLALGSQLTADVPEVANQLLFLGIDRDRRLAGPSEAGDTCIDMLELGIAIGMLAALAGLGVAFRLKPMSFSTRSTTVWSTR